MEFYKPEHILNHLDLKDIMVACDFGCGAGHFAISLAKRSPQAKIFGLDENQEKISHFKSKIKLEKLQNVFPICCNFEDLPIRRNFVDLAVIHSLPFLTNNFYDIIIQIKRILKNKGLLAIVVPFDFPISKLKQKSEESNFLLKKEFLAGDLCQGLIFKKE